MGESHGDTIGEHRVQFGYIYPAATASRSLVPEALPSTCFGHAEISLCDR
jgi:hypothetical protein